MNPLWKDQILAIVRLELKKTFFAKRGLWIYFLALAPLLMFAGHAIDEMGHRKFRREMARESVRPLSREEFAAIHEGMTRDEVITRLGPAPEIRDWGNGVNPGAIPPRAHDPATPGGIGLICLRSMMDRAEFTPQPDGMLLTLSKRRP